jgi:mono/diheme cytochrome c family protein
MKLVTFAAITGLCLAAASVSAADVKANWEKHCQKCHGADGKGQTTMGKKLKVLDYTDAKAQAKFTDEQAIKITTEGKKEGDKTLMKSYKEDLSAQEIKDLIAYVRKFAKN